LQELKSKRSPDIQNKPINDSSVDSSRCSADDSSVLNLRAVDQSTEVSNSVGPENSNSRRKQNRSRSKQQSIYKQRLFSGNFKAEADGNVRNSIGMISESPTSETVGFFFGSTPLDNLG